MSRSVTEPRAPEFWAKHIELAAQSPDGVTKYCKANGLAFQTFYGWRRRLQGNSAKKLRKKSVEQKTNPFAKITVVEAAMAKPPLPEAKWVAELIFHLYAGAR